VPSTSTGAVADTEEDLPDEDEDDDELDMDELNELEASLAKTSVQTHGPGIKASSWERERERWWWKCQFTTKWLMWEYQIYQCQWNWSTFQVGAFFCKFTEVDGNDKLGHFSVMLFTSDMKILSNIDCLWILFSHQYFTDLISPFQLIRNGSSLRYGGRLRVCLLTCLLTRLWLCFN